MCRYVSLLYEYRDLFIDMAVRNNCSELAIANRMEVQKCITYYLPGVLPRLETKSHTALLTTHFNSVIKRYYSVQPGNRTLLHSSIR